MSGTEESILGNIPDFQDEGGADVSSPADSGTTTDDSSEGGGRSSAQPTQTTAQPTQQTTPQQYQRRRADGLVEQPDPNNPASRSLVDPMTGQVVAKGGIERRIFEESQRAQRENTQLKQRVSGLEGALRQSNEVIQEAARLGIAPQDQLIAVRVMSDFMRDPVRTLQTLVEEVKAKGYQIPFLSEGVSQGMDMSALSRMIDAKLQPIMGRHQMEAQQQQARQQAQRDLDSFLEENQEANANLDVLSEMLQAQPGLPLPSAYTKMIRWAHENGLDWTRPLKQQIAAMRQQQPTHQQPEQRPLPGRRSATQQGTQRMNGAGAGNQFNENASWADIIRSAMEESGQRVQ